MVLSTGGINSYNTGIVSGSELERVSREIFGSAKEVSLKPKTTAVDLTKTTTRFQTVDTGVNFFEKGTDLALTKQVSVRNAGLDIQLSQGALSNIQALNIAAAASNAKAQTVNVDKQVEGKLYLPADGSIEKGDLKSVFSMPNTPQLFNTSNLDKDRRGSGPFSYRPQTKNQESSEEDQGLSIFA